MKVFMFMLTCYYLNMKPYFLMFLISSMTLIMLIKILKILSTEIYSMIFMLDSLTLILIILSMMTTIFIFMSTNMKKFSKMMIIIIMIILFITFSISKTILFYIFFEMVLIPTLMLITKLGPQPERLQAGMYLLLYTVMASLPLLLGILYYKNCESMYNSNILFKKINLAPLFMLAFLAKSPMFILHLWLPKAHVEAPLEGSMVLAAILLKLGGYGLIRFYSLLFFYMKFIPHWISSISMLGAIYTSMGCIRQKDIKALIAYSSVAHMAIVLTSIFMNSKTSMNGAIIMMIAHGISSSALFFLVNMSYMKFNTRNIISMKNNLSTNPNLTFWWFMFIMVNISAPPSINLLAEIMMFMSIIKWNLMMSTLIFFIIMLSMSFCIIMFVSMNHGMSTMKMSNLDPNKFFLSLTTHLLMTIFLILKMEFMLM